MSSATPRSGIRIVVALAAIVGCKPAPGTAPPGRADVSDDIAEIEATLARNAENLQANGIVVAQRSEPPPATESTAPDAAGEPPEPAADEDGGEETDVEAGVEAEGEEADMPEPAPVPEPATPSTIDRDTSSRRAYRKRWLERRRDKKEESEQCQRICDLAEATCELADRICALAQRHPDEPRYEAACENADAQCGAAADACSACAGS